MRHTCADINLGLAHVECFGLRAKCEVVRWKVVNFGCDMNVRALDSLSKCVDPETCAHHSVTAIDQRAVKVFVASSDSSWYHRPTQIGLEPYEARRISPVPESATEPLDRAIDKLFVF